MRILIAEDDGMSRMVLEATLRSLGHDVVSTEHGKQAWELFQTEAFPVLITDWMMPEMDGPLLCRLIRYADQPEYTYIIVLTGLGGKANYLEAMEAGADDFVTKPFDAEVLEARLHVAERIIGLRRHVSQLEGLLPVCSYCKRIRDDQDHWQEIESYIARRSEVKFSHSICQECYNSHVKPELEELFRESDSVPPGTSQ